MTIYIVGKWIGLINSEIEADFTGVLGVYSGVTAMSTMVIQFHRGSSSGSQIKTNLLKR